MLPFPRLERSGSPAANRSAQNQKRGNATLVLKGKGHEIELILKK
jgi:hypothetical protein